MFKTIKAKNLFSWEDLTYEVKRGVSQITGFNYDDNTPEGSGKSAIPNSLCWTLYGAIPKDAKVDEVIREGESGGSGEVTLLNGYKVVRSRKPNDLYIVEPKGKVVRGRDARETQQMVTSLIGMDFDAFCQTVYFAQNYPNKFVDANEADKARILSQIQDLTVFDKARTKTINLIKTKEAEKVQASQKLIIATAAAEKAQSNAKLLTDFIDKFEKDKVQKLNLVHNKHAELIAKIENTDVVDIDAVKKEQEEIDAAIQEVNAEKVEYAATVKNGEAVQRELLRAKNHYDSFAAKIERAVAKNIRLLDKVRSFSSQDVVPGACPTCGQPAKKATIDRHKAEHAAQLLELTEEADASGEEVKELQAEQAKAKEALEKAQEAPSVDNAKKALAKLEKDTLNLNNIRRQIQEQANLYQRQVSELKAAQVHIEMCKTELEKIKATNCDAEKLKLAGFTTEFDLAKDKQALAEADLANLTKEINNLEILKAGYKEVKQYVFQSLLKDLSNKATAFAEELFEVPVKIEFSNEDDEGAVSKIKTLVTLDGNERSLGLFSGGQFRRITIAVDLALATIVGNRSLTPIKFRILDEPMKDLSETSMEKVIKLLERLEGPTIIIEHNSIAKSIVTNTFHAEFRNGISRAS